MARRGLLIGAAVLVLTGGAAVTATARETASVPTNDGLPTQWFGITKWTGGLPGIPPEETIAHVTLTLTKKLPYTRSAQPPISRGYFLGQKGIAYGYSPRGTITVTGECKAPLKGQLKPVDGGLAIDVETKTRRAAYWGQDSQTLQADIPHTCPDGLQPAGADVTYWGFRTTPDYNPILRSMSVSATRISGDFVDPQALRQGLKYRYEWCFVRAPKDLLKCGYVVTGEPG